jgi:hypothetical protein
MSGMKKYKRIKNPLYDMDVCVNQKYLKSGELTTVKIPEGFLKPYKEFALDNNTNLQDLVSMALFKFGLAHNFLINSPKSQRRFRKVG